MTISARALAATLLACGCAALPAIGGAGPQYWAFTAPWDPRSDSSARQHADRFGAVVYGWFALDTLTGLPVTVFPDTLSRLAPATTRRMAIVTNAVGGLFHPEVVRELAAADQALRRTALDLAGRAANGGYRGLVLDFEGLSPGDLPSLLKVVQAIAAAARAREVGPVVVAIPATDTAGYPAGAFFPGADYVLVMLYDQHWATSPPGPIASPEWARQWLARRVAEVGASRVIASLPLYGYAWAASGGRPASPVSFDEASRMAAASGVSLARDPASGMLHADAPGRWTVWVSDADFIRGIVSDVETTGVHVVALWRVGLEDPRLWNLLTAKAP